MSENKLMELKAHKLLAQLRNTMLSNIQRQSRSAVEYEKNKPDDAYQRHENVANPAKWDKSGILGKSDIAVMEVLEYLLDDSKDEIVRYREWTCHPK